MGLVLTLSQVQKYDQPDVEYIGCTKQVSSDAQWTIARLIKTACCILVVTVIIKYC